LVPTARIAAFAPPTIKAVGFADVSVGVDVGVLTERFAVALPPPGEGLATVTASFPAVASSATERLNVNCVGLTSVGVWAAVPTWTVDAPMKFAPLIVMV